MGFFLEVIVTSAADAVEAEAGGADRLELVAGLNCGGLTPTMQTIESVLRAVTIPVRVMLRHKPTMSIEDQAELEHLKSAARLLSQSKIDGLVAGFLRGGAIDEQAMLEIASAAPRIPITFHRAFDDAHSPDEALKVLKRLPQIDRVLFHGSSDAGQSRLSCALQLQQTAMPELRVVFAAGLHAQQLLEGMEATDALEIHVGRAVRIPQDVSGRVSRAKVAALKACKSSSLHNQNLQ